MAKTEKTSIFNRKNRLQQKRKDELLEAVRESREAFQRGDVNSGTVAELIQELAEK